MSATKTPNIPLPDNAPSVTKEWSPASGEIETRSWGGTREDIGAKYEAEKALAETAGGGSDVAQLVYSNDKGRAKLIMRLTPNDPLPGFGEGVQIVEELYAVDVIKDILESPYFSITVDGAKGLPLSNDNAAFVRLASEQRWTEAQITANASIAAHQWANWDDGMKELRYHLLNGVESYYETGFVLRRSSYGIQFSAVKASFEGVNTIDTTDPGFSSPMEELILSLPDGEWLRRPPSCEFLGRGRWRVDEEWHWAQQWSVVYGGSWNV